MIQKAFLWQHGSLPISRGVDVINIRGLSFLRFLEIADLLKREVVVVTDNDADYGKNVKRKYAAYEGNRRIRICATDNDNLSTLEPNLIACNQLSMLNRIFGTSYADAEDMLKYMIARKTECALKLFEASEPIVFPEYILDAVR